MKESISFKWMSEDGSSVMIDNNVMTAFDANGQELSHDSDDAQDLFIEMSMVLEDTMMLAHPKDVEPDDFRWELHKSLRHNFRFGPMPMFGRPCHFRRGNMLVKGFVGDNDFADNDFEDPKNASDEELAYKFRKRMIKEMKHEREMEREREAKRQREIIESAIPYEVENEICPDELIDDSNEYHLKDKGTTIITVGHDKNNASLYNIINKVHRFLLKKHQQRMNCVEKTRYIMCDENKVLSYFDAGTEQMLFQTKPGIVDYNVFDNGIEYEDGEHNYIYDKDGNLLATVGTEYKLRRIINGRPVVEKDNKYVYNIILPDGSFMLQEPAKKIWSFGCDERFEVIRKDGISEIYSTDDFHKVYESEKPRHVECIFGERPDKNMFIFTSDDDYNYGIIVDVMSGEVITKDKDGTPKDYKNIEYPKPNNKNWRAEISVKTYRIEKFDPTTGKRVTNKKDKA
jgi:hypothetical protein